MHRDVESLRAEHHTAVAAFVVTARAIPDALWNDAPSHGKWSPAQIADHLRLTYDVLGAEQAGGAGLRLRTSFAVRAFLRLYYLPRILRSGRLPAGVRAPREVRPGTGPFDRDTTLAALEASSAAFEDLLARSAPGQTMTHHLLGSLNARKAWRFVAVHTEHHRRQLVERTGG